MICYKFFNRSVGKFGVFFMSGVVSGEFRKKNFVSGGILSIQEVNYFLIRKFFSCLFCFFIVFLIIVGV